VRLLPLMGESNQSRGCPTARGTPFFCSFPREKTKKNKNNPRGGLD
jgi:hypothetical protein